MKVMPFSIMAATWLAVGSASSADAHAPQTSLSRADQKFLQRASQATRLEIALGHLAAEKGSSSGVKEFARRVVDDHTRIEDEIERVAMEKGLALDDSAPKSKDDDPNPMGLDSAGRKTVLALSKSSRGGFDHSYLERMILEHTKTVKDFEDQSRNAQNGDVRSLAAAALPVLQGDLRMAKAARKSGG